MSKKSSALGWAGATVSLCAAALLVACGGGGGGGATDGGGGPGTVTATLSADVYPLASGDRRSWRTTVGSAVGAVRHERVGEVVAGAFILRSGGSDLQLLDDDEYLQRNATGVSSVPGPGSDALTRAAGPVELLRFGVPQGQTVVLYDRSLSVDVDGDGRADTVDLRIESQFVGVEAVTTSLAAFADASRVRTIARSVVRLAGTPASSTITQSLEDWYVPGLGSVRTSSSTVVDGGAPAAITEELVAYAVGSRRSESVAPTVAQSVPANDSLAGAGTELRLGFSEPIDPLSLLGEQGLKVFADGVAMAPQSLQLSADAKTLTIALKTYPLPDARYELRSGGQVSDWAGNATPALLSSFRVDTTGPRLLSTLPAQGAAEAPLSGTLSFTFNEPVTVPTGAALKVVIRPALGVVEQTLPSTLQGSSITATITTPLQPNTEYFAYVAQGPTDAAGNPMGSAMFSFRTDPGAFGRPQSWVANFSSIGSVAVADVDGDGRSDFVFTGISQGIYAVGARLQQADGRYGDVKQLYAFTTTNFCELNGLAVADLDGDGRADVIVRGECKPLDATTILRQRSDGSFAAESSPVDFLLGAFAPMEAGAGQAGIVGVAADGLRHLRRAADGNWLQTLLAPTGSLVLRDWRPVDLDGDGRNDLIWVQQDNDGAQLAWRLRTASGWGAVQTRPLPTGTVIALATGDLNGDGRQDVVMTVEISASAPDSDSEVRVLHQTAAGGFDDPQRLAAASSASALLVGDLNSDGRADVVVAHDSLTRTGIFLQSSNGGLQAERLFEANYGSFGTGRRRPLALLDLNGDGYKDIVQAEILLPGRAFSGVWPLGANAPAVAARTGATNRLLRAAGRVGGAATQ